MELRAQNKQGGTVPMASVGNDLHGHKRILFMACDGRRKTIRLGKVTARQANAFKVKVENLVGQTITGIADDEVTVWLMELGQKTYDKLEAVGLVRPGQGRSQTLSSLLDGYIAGRAADAKRRTLINFDQARKRMVPFFGPNKLIKDITVGDAEDWGRWLVSEGLAVSTARRTCGRAKQFFNYAINKQLIGSNPFRKLKSTVGGNPLRKFFVTEEMSRKILESCPNAEWRLRFGLCRYGGLRHPSEVEELRWADFNLATNQITVRSPKTAHHEGKAVRTIPYFYELESLVTEAFMQADESRNGSIFAKCKDEGAQSRGQLGRIIHHAGLAPYPKAFHNLRATRQTELAGIWSIHKVCEWMGNSLAVAQEHYLQITQDDYDQAARRPAHIPAQPGSETDDFRLLGLDKQKPQCP